MNFYPSDRLLPSHISLPTFWRRCCNLKIEISERTMGAKYDPMHFLGISALVMKPEDMIAGKLAALLTRRQFASRDMFDLHFFLSHHWSIQPQTLKAHTGTVRFVTKTATAMIPAHQRIRSTNEEGRRPSVNTHTNNSSPESTTKDETCPFRICWWAL